MRKTTGLKIALSLGALISASAMAQSSFEGAYGQFGIGYQSSKMSTTGGVYQGTSYTNFTTNANSFSAAIGAGYYFPVTQSFLLGVGADFSPIKGSQGTDNVSISGYNTVSGNFYQKTAFSAFVSPALAISKNQLAYAKVGYGGANFQTGNGAFGYGTSVYSGYLLGLGYKQMIANNWYGFGEVNYVAYGSQSDGGGATGTNKYTTTSALVGLGYKF